MVLSRSIGLERWRRRWRAWGRASARACPRSPDGAGPRVSTGPEESRSRRGTGSGSESGRAGKGHRQARCRCRRRGGMASGSAGDTLAMWRRASRWSGRVFAGVAALDEGAGLEVRAARRSVRAGGVDEEQLAVVVRGHERARWPGRSRTCRGRRRPGRCTTSGPCRGARRRCWGVEVVVRLGVRDAEREHVGAAAEEDRDDHVALGAAVVAGERNAREPRGGGGEAGGDAAPGAAMNLRRVSARTHDNRVIFEDMPWSSLRGGTGESERVEATWRMLRAGTRGSEAQKHWKAGEPIARPIASRGAVVSAGSAAMYAADAVAVGRRASRRANSTWSMRSAICSAVVRPAKSVVEVDADAVDVRAISSAAEVPARA